jgi:uncharacterized membrane protein
MTGFARSHLVHHGRFYVCALLGAAVYAACRGFAPPVRLLAAGDSFFAAYVAIMAIAALRLTPQALDAKADIEDEGIAIVVLVTLVMIGFSSLAIFTVLHQKGAPDMLALSLAAAGAPLGWFMLHMLMAFHYANLFYSEPGGKGGSGLEFPGNTPEPGIADFLYYSFVVGMTAQVSDVQVTSTRIRRMTLGHGIVSFFLNTVLIAMAVNAAVAIAA